MCKIIIKKTNWESGSIYSLFRVYLVFDYTNQYNDFIMYELNLNSMIIDNIIMNNDNIL